MPGEIKPQSSDTVEEREPPPRPGGFAAGVVVGLVVGLAVGIAVGAALF